MKHNKKRNTAFIYETLSKELTKSIINKEEQKKRLIVSIIKEHFGKNSILGKELSLYKALLETENIQEVVAERLLQEAKGAHSRLDKDKIFEAQSQVIAAINKSVGQHTWSNFITNFKSLASINAIFSNKTSVKKKILFEQAVVNKMSARKEPGTIDELKTIDNLTYRTFIKNFNDKYGDLLQEQKDLLNRYITSFADDGFELRLYLNEELARLKDYLKTSSTTILEPTLSKKINEVTEYLEGFRKREFTDIDLNKVLKTQELVQELSSND
jgi:hypothetical protein